MVSFLTRLTQPRPRSASALSALYDVAAHGWQDGIEKLGFDAAYADLVAAALPDISTDARVLDAGCGTGDLSQALRAGTAHSGPLTLLDLSAQMLDQAARRFPQATRHQAAIGGAHPPTAPFDLILCAHVIEHCDDPGAALRWLRALLAPGGRMLLAVSRPHWCTALVRWRWGHASYRPEELARLLMDAGFDAPRSFPFRSGPPSRLSCGYLATT